MIIIGNQAMPTGNDSLYHLMYISRSRLADSNDTEQKEKELASILNSAQYHNPINGITGAMLYSDGYYCQILEGPRTAIEKLFEIIKNDSRHSQIKLLYFNPIAERHFEHWRMALAGVEDQLPSQIDGLLNSQEQIQISTTGFQILNMMKDLVLKHEMPE